MEMSLDKTTLSFGLIHVTVLLLKFNKTKNICIAYFSAAVITLSILLCLRYIVTNEVIYFKFYAYL